MEVDVAKDNINARVLNAKRLLHTWLATPSNFGPLFTAASAIGPVVDQLIKSSYIFQFNLPAPLVQRFGSLGNVWFLYRCNGIRYGQKPIQSLAYGMAVSQGPNQEACGSRLVYGNAGGYATSVQRRAADVNTSFFENIRLYREGLASQPWIPLESTRVRLVQRFSSRGGATRELGSGDTRSDAFYAPATVVWGMKDPALNFAAVADGVEKCMMPGSHILTVRRAGHWVPAERAGIEVLGKTIAWVLQGAEVVAPGGRLEKRPLSGWLDAEVPPDVEWNLTLEK